MYIFIHPVPEPHMNAKPIAAMHKLLISWTFLAIFVRAFLKNQSLVGIVESIQSWLPSPRWVILTRSLLNYLALCFSLTYFSMTLKAVWLFWLSMSAILSLKPTEIKLVSNWKQRFKVLYLFTIYHTTRVSSLRQDLINHCKS